MLKRSLKILETLAIYVAFVGIWTYFMLWCEVVRPAVTPITTAVVMLTWGVYNAQLDRLNGVLVALSLMFYVESWRALGYTSQTFVLGAFVLSVILWVIAAARRIHTGSRASKATAAGTESRKHGWMSFD